jgi:aflatoxin B1 aldehyde reductase
MSIASKANNKEPRCKSLSAESVVHQCSTSLKSFCVDVIDLYYLHGPDIATEINNTLDGINQLHREGKIKEFGISNYPAWKVVDIYHRCVAKGMMRPTVYQGIARLGFDFPRVFICVLSSRLSRRVQRYYTRCGEGDYACHVREFGIRLHGYNPLAGGLLAGEYKSINDTALSMEGRFSAKYAGTAANPNSTYCERYIKQAVFDGVDVLVQASRQRTESESK